MFSLCRSKTCPFCRKPTKSKLIRLFFDDNLNDTIENLDPDALKSRLDNAQVFYIMKLFTSLNMTRI